MSDGQEDQPRNELDGITRGPVFARLFIVFLVKLADQLLEDRAHRMVIDPGRREGNVGIEELVDQRAKGVGSG